MELCDAARQVCAAIVAGDEAWSRRDELESRHGEAALACALGLGAVEVWDRPDYPAVTLTPWGAAVVGVEVDEVWRKEKQPADEQQPDDARFLEPPPQETVMVESPRLVPSGTARHRTDQPPRYGRVGRVRVVPLARPELVPDRDEYLTDDDGEPVTVLGQAVRIDRRIR